MTEYMLTTVDNPFNPHTHFDEWNAFDQQLGYNTLSLLARVVRTSNDHPETFAESAIDRGIEEIARHNVSGMHRRVAASEKFSDPDPD